MLVRLRRVALLAAVALAGCSASQAAPTGPGERPPSSDQAEASGTAAVPATTSPAGAALKPGELPTLCASVTIPARLAGLQVATSAQQTYTPVGKADPLPTDEAGAEQEGRVRPGLACLYPATAAGQEATVQVMPDTSPFFTTRQTTTCKPTYGKGEKVMLGSVPGWYCPTTNESAIEWVSYVHDGRLVVVARLSKPAATGPYRAQLVAYATELVARV